jgi:ubiquinone biosynthesis protein UbiJ
VKPEGEQVQVVAGEQEASCRIELDAGDLLKIVQGRANAFKLYQQGRIQLSAGHLGDEVARDLVTMLQTDP